MIHAGVDGQLYFNSWCANRISNVFGARLRCVDLISGYDYEMPKKQVARGGCKVQKFEFQSRLEASPPIWTSHSAPLDFPSIKFPIHYRSISFRAFCSGETRANASNHDGFSLVAT